MLYSLYVQGLVHEQNISLHINNIYKEGELDKNSTVKESLTVQKEGKRTVQRKIEQYSLDVIISTGYRVKSLRGTQFRIWANKVLKEYLLEGYSINEKKLKEHTKQLDSLKRTMRILGNVAESKFLTSDEASGLFKILTDYAYALDVLDKYDHGSLKLEATHNKSIFLATYTEAIKAIHGLKDKFGGSSLFANEKDESFKSSIATIYQSFGGKDLYPSIKEKAAHLLYFVVKNHSFSDGNKRIAAF